MSGILLGGRGRVRAYPAPQTTTMGGGGGGGGGGGAYDDFESDPLDNFVYAFSDLEVMANYTAFASDPTEVFGFDTEAQP